MDPWAFKDLKGGSPEDRALKTFFFRHNCEIPQGSKTDGIRAGLGWAGLDIRRACLSKGC